MTNLGELTEADLDREEVNRKGLARFIALAWHQVEPRRLQWNWHLDAICEHLEAVSRCEITNLLILVPPGCMKSLAVAVFWPAWMWSFEPETKWVFSSYGQSLSYKSARQHRNLCTSEWYQDRWGDKVTLAAESAKQVGLFENTAKGLRFSTSVDGEATGRHGDLIVFDDLVKAQDAQGRRAVDHKAITKANEFWEKVMPTREANPATTRKVGIMQRLHYQDTAARCIATGDYEVLCLPMEFEPKRKCTTSLGWEDPRTKEGELLWPERFSNENLTAKRRTMGSRIWHAQFQQRPSPPEGTIFKKKWFRYWGVPGSALPELPKRGNMLVIQSWDMAFKGNDDSDWVVGEVWAKWQTFCILLAEIRGQMNFVETVYAVKDLSKRYPKAYTKLVENKANGPAVVNYLENNIPGLVLVEPQGGKEARAHAVEPAFEAGDVLLPHKTIAPWIDEYEEEILAFPLGAADDRVDATTQALIRLTGGGSQWLEAMRAASRKG